MNDIVIKQVDKNNLYVEAKFENRNYFCDYVADDNANQVEVFQEVGAPIIKSFLQGYNCTVFSYGQTGSGKTYTMIGPTNSLLSENNNEKRGLIPRIMKGIFQEVNNLKKDKKLTSATIKCSCFEIYQETIIDLV
jgi:kinesin family protein 15